MITVYGREDCVQCVWTKRWLERLGHNYTDIDLDTDIDAASYLASLEPEVVTLPFVVTDTDSWCGFKLDKLRGIPRTDRGI